MWASTVKEQEPATTPPTDKFTVMMMSPRPLELESLTDTLELDSEDQLDESLDWLLELELLDDWLLELLDESSTTPLVTGCPL
jgi:hypothetical protein